MSNSIGAGTEALLELYDVMSDERRTFEGKIESALEVGARYLGVENAHLTRIEPDVDYWEAIASTDDETGEFPPGLVLDLQTTYCRRVLADGESIALHDAPSQGWGDDPAFESHELYCYHGTPVHVDGELFGTLCFVSGSPRESAFSESETLFAELVARLVEHELSVERFEGEARRRANSVTVLSRVLRHNLRNEMTILRGKIGELAAMDVDVDSSVGIVDEIYETIDEIISLSDKARKLETIISTQFDTNPVALEPLLERVVTDVTLNTSDATVEVVGAENATVEARQSLELALRELVENAVKHGNDPPSVRIDVTERDKRVAISVADDGPGLPDQERAVLSEGVETPLVHGSGLGLWMVYWIVSNHEGEIDAHVGDDGTTITVTLPRTRATGGALDRDAVQKLERGLDRFEAVFEESFDAMVLVNDERRIVDANDQAGELLGVEPKELMGRSFESFVADQSEFASRWRDLQATGTGGGEFKLWRQDGTVRTVEYTASADVVPGQHLLIGRDITERRARERQFDVIFNQTFQFTGLLDADGTVVEINDTALAFAGTDRESILGLKLWELPPFKHDDTPARVKAAFERAREGAFVRSEVDVQGADSRVPIDFSLKPVLDDDGDVERIIAEGRDISELKETEREARENRQRLEAIVAACPDPIVAVDESGTIELWNEAAEDVLGYPAEAVIGESFAEIGLHSGSEQPEVADRFKRALAGETFRDLRVSRRRSDGSQVTLSISTAPILGADDEVEGVIAVMKPLDGPRVSRSE